MSKTDSSGIPDVLEIQGFGIMMRKAVSVAPINLSIRQHGNEEIFIDQTTTASIPAINEEWYPGDHKWREQDDKVMGKVKSRAHWAKVSELEDTDAQLVKGLSDDDEIIEAEVESLGATVWKARQVWCFESERFVRRVFVTGKNGDTAFSRLVYDFEQS